MLNDIDFDVGNIAYNEFHIDFDKNLCEQESSLTEDLLQVEYPNNYLIDLGGILNVILMEILLYL